MFDIVGRTTHMRGRLINSIMLTCLICSFESWLIARCGSTLPSRVVVTRLRLNIFVFVDFCRLARSHRH